MSIFRTHGACKRGSEAVAKEGQVLRFSLKMCAIYKKAESCISRAGKKTNIVRVDDATPMTPM